jgi:hypothetical protein
MGTSINPHFIPTDGTTDMTTSHLTNPAKGAGQVIGYSHSTDETPSHSTRLSKNDNQVAGYKSPKNGNQVAGYAALRKKFRACIYSICGAAKFFPRLADDSARGCFCP